MTDWQSRQDFNFALFLLDFPFWQVIIYILPYCEESATAVFCFFHTAFIHGKCSFRYFFVAYLHTGVQGAAMTTILSQIVMTIFIMIYGTRKYKWLRFRFSRKIFSFRAIKEEGSFEFPPMLQSCISSLGGLIL